MTNRIHFVSEGKDYYTCRHHGLLGVVTYMHGNAMWGVMVRPNDTAQWHKARTIKGAKRACARVLREGRDWKDRREASTDKLLAMFKAKANLIARGGPPQLLYATCLEMQRLWFELERRGLQPLWPDNQPTPFGLTA